MTLDYIQPTARTALKALTVSFEADSDVADFLRDAGGFQTAHIVNKAVRLFAETAVQAYGKKQLLTTREVQIEFGTPAATLTTLRTRGGGPRFRKFGRSVKYHRDDVEAWIAEHPSQRSTSEQGAATQHKGGYS